MKKYKKILLIGGEGYVGSVVKNYFLAKNFYVDSIDCLLYENETSVISNNSENYNFKYGELSQIDKITKINDYDLIILFAGLVGDPVVRKYSKLSTKINVYDIQNIIIFLSKKYKNNFFFISTCSNYGLMQNNDRANEDFNLNPISNYAKAKVSAEKLIMNTKNNASYKPTIFRFATAFGISPRMRFDLTLNQFVLDIYNNIPLEIYDPDTWRPYCHVQDFAQILYQTYKLNYKKRYFEIFNAGFNNNHSTKRELVYKIVKLLNTDMKNIKFINKKGSDQRNYKVDFSKINEKVLLKQKFTIKKGITELKKYLDNNIFKNYSINSNKGNFKVIRKVR